MTQVQIAFGRVSMRNMRTLAPALIAASVVSEDLVPTESSEATTIAAPDPGDGDPICRVANAFNAAVHVAFGGAPNAETAHGRVLVLPGAVEYFYVDAGDKAAVMIAAEPEDEGEGEGE